MDSQPQHSHEHEDEHRDEIGPPQYVIDGPNYLVTLHRGDMLIQVVAMGASIILGITILVRIWQNDISGVVANFVGLAALLTLLNHYRRIKASPEVEFPGAEDGAPRPRAQLGVEGANRNANASAGGGDGDGDGDGDADDGANRYAY